MFRQAVARPLSSSRPMLNRSFSALAPRMADGDSASKGGPVRTTTPTDQFQRREAAQEAMYIREKELERLKELRAKINEQRQSLDNLEKHINELSGNQGNHK